MRVLKTNVPANDKFGLYKTTNNNASSNLRELIGKEMLVDYWAVVEAERINDDGEPETVEKVYFLLDDGKLYSTVSRSFARTFGEFCDNILADDAGQFNPALKFAFEIVEKDTLKGRKCLIFNATAVAMEAVKGGEENE